MIESRLSDVKGLRTPTPMPTPRRLSWCGTMRWRHHKHPSVRDMQFEHQQRSRHSWELHIPTLAV